MVYVGCEAAKREHGPGSVCYELKLDDDWLTAQYYKFNRMYFDKKLPLTTRIYFRGNKNGSRMGTCFGQKNIFRGITINPYQSKDSVIRTLLHEMVHAEQYLVRKTDGNHGRWFKSRCRELTILTKGKYGTIPGGSKIQERW